MKLILFNFDFYSIYNRWGLGDQINCQIWWLYNNSSIYCFINFNTITNNLGPMHKKSQPNLLPLSISTANLGRMPAFLGFPTKISNKNESEHNKLYEKMENRLCKQGKKENAQKDKKGNGAVKKYATQRNPVTQTAKNNKTMSVQNKTIRNTIPVIQKQIIQQKTQKKVQQIQPETKDNIQVNISIINALQDATQQIENTSPDAKQSSRDKGLLKNYRSENKLKKYHYLQPEPQRGNPIRVQTSLYSTLIATTKHQKQSTRDLKYHYYHNPNIAHRPDHQQTRLRSRSGNSTNSLSYLLGYAGDRQRARHQRQRSITSIERVHLHGKSAQRQVHLLKQRCQNIIKEVGQSENLAIHRYNYLQQMQRAQRQTRHRSRELDRLRDKQREIQLRERKIMQREKEIQRNCRRLREDQSLKREKQIKIRQRREMQEIARREQQIMRQKQQQRHRERQILLLQLQRQKHQTLSQASPYICEFKVQENPENPCTCRRECSCTNLTTQLNTSRLHRLNNKLENYIARNMAATMHY